jgi:hypothetical protein
VRWTNKEVYMKNILIPRISMLALAGVLATCFVARADTDDGPCSNRTLRGNYGFAIEGLILAIPGAPALPAPLPLRAVALTTFDGKGNLTQLDHYVVNGAAPSQPWQASTGTYTVNPNCTGDLILNVPGNPLSPFKLYFVVLSKGSEIRTVVDANLVSSVGRRIE